MSHLDALLQFNYMIIVIIIIIMWVDNIRMDFGEVG
jgi:hypothetical protein